MVLGELRAWESAFIPPYIRGADMRVKPESRETAAACVCPGRGRKPCDSILHLRRATRISARIRRHIDAPSLISLPYARGIPADRQRETGGSAPTATDSCGGESGRAARGTPLASDGVEQTWVPGTVSRILTTYELA